MCLTVGVLPGVWFGRTRRGPGTIRSSASVAVQMLQTKNASPLVPPNGQLRDPGLRAPACAMHAAVEQLAAHSPLLVSTREGSR